MTVWSSSGRALWGLLCAVVAKAYGAKKIVLVDILEKKLEFAKEYVKGCETYLSEKGKSAEENAQEIIDRFQLGAGADVVLEATGAEPCICAGIHVVKPGGRYVQGGLGPTGMQIPHRSHGYERASCDGCHSVLWRRLQNRFGFDP